MARSASATTSCAFCPASAAIWTSRTARYYSSTRVLTLDGLCSTRWRRRWRARRVSMRAMSLRSADRTVASWSRISLVSQLHIRFKQSFYSKIDQITDCSKLGVLENRKKSCYRPVSVVLQGVRRAQSRPQCARHARNHRHSGVVREIFYFVETKQTD